MMSNHPSIFENNPDVSGVVPVDERVEDLVTIVGGRYVRLAYSEYDAEADRSTPTKRHVIAELCARAGITGEIAVRPYLHLRKDEVVTANLATDRIVVQSSGLAARFGMRNKEWYPERMASVVNAMGRTAEFIQVGAESDPRIDGAIDLRGKTSIRELGALLSRARLFVGLEGFVMHIARAVECPAVIIFGGRTAPWQFGYSCNTNIYSAVDCSPCWLWNRCDFDRACMQRIEANHVVDAIGAKLSEPRGPLRVDRVVL